MTDSTNAIRLYGRDVGLDPAVNGADNVQDALDAATSVTLGNDGSDVVQADTATPLTGDGGAHTIPCIIAAPPTWMDNAGNITEPGLYAISTTVVATAGPTTPGQYIKVEAQFGSKDWVPCDALGAAGVAQTQDVQALGAINVPSDASSFVTMPTDATEAVDVQITVARLAY